MGHALGGGGDGGAYAPQLRPRQGNTEAGRQPRYLHHPLRQSGRRPLQFLRLQHAAEKHGESLR